MGLAQDYWKIASPRFGRPQLTRDISQPYLSMTQPVYWLAAGLQGSTSAALAAVGTNQDVGLEYRSLASARFGRPQLTRESAPFMPTPLYFANYGPMSTALASAVLAATGRQTVFGTMATTLAALVLAATGKETDYGTLASTLASAVLASTGKETDYGTLATTLASVVLAGTGKETDYGTLATALASVVLAATGKETDSGTLDTALAALVLAGTGGETEGGTFASTLAALVLDATGQVLTYGDMDVELANLVLAASGGDTGTLATTLESLGMAATGGVGRMFFRPTYNAFSVIRGLFRTRKL